MFHICTEYSFTHNVTVSTPVNAGFREEMCRVTYRIIPVDQASKFDLSTPEGTRDFLRAAVVRFDDLVDDQNRPFACTDDVREQLLHMPHVRNAVLRAYMMAVSKTAPEK